MGNRKKLYGNKKQGEEMESEMLQSLLAEIGRVEGRERERKGKIGVIFIVSSMCFRLQSSRRGQLMSKHVRIGGGGGGRGRGGGGDGGMGKRERERKKKI